MYLLSMLRLKLKHVFQSRKTVVRATKTIPSILFLRFFVILKPRFPNERDLKNPTYNFSNLRNMNNSENHEMISWTPLSAASRR